jgi:spore coat polysaccharide biosynthesis protein SpsF (cytidylyltransferase family)/aryl-alcohol dehydrogenase-like predicted oxidoreductase
MNAVVVVQARTSSHRLPGKCLLNIRGQAIASVAALRAANTGLSVVVATSTDISDDLLSDQLAGDNIAIFRGDLVDVLKRFCDALSEFPDDLDVVRLTADNIVPDGTLIEEILEEFRSSGLDYITTNDSTAGLPYGVSIEVTKLKHLREANNLAESEYEREHVTPYIIKKFGRTVFKKYSSLRLDKYRMTIDNFDDFISIGRALPKGRDIKSLPWREIVSLVNKSGLYQPLHAERLDKFVLGTVQIGMPYGIKGDAFPSENERKEMLKVAIGAGVKYLDTARIYGQSERLIGEINHAGWKSRYSVITKIKIDNYINSGHQISSIKLFAEAELAKSRRALRLNFLDNVLVHELNDYFMGDGALRDYLTESKQKGELGSIGVSVQSPEELRKALDEPDFELIQLPFNIMDWRWEGLVEKLKERKRCSNLKVHVRSVFLQGLLLSKEAQLWNTANVAAGEKAIEWLESMVKKLKRENIADLCVAWARSQDWVDGVVIGAGNLSQIIDNIKLFRYGDLSNSEMQEISASRPVLQVNSLDPTQWQK